MNTAIYLATVDPITYQQFQLLKKELGTPIYVNGVIIDYKLDLVSIDHPTAGNKLGYWAYDKNASEWILINDEEFIKKCEIQESTLLYSKLSLLEELPVKQQQIFIEELLDECKANNCTIIYFNSSLKWINDYVVETYSGFGIKCLEFVNQNNSAKWVMHN